MRKVLLMSHGKFAEGIYDTVKMLIGEYGDVFVYSAYSKNESESIPDFIKKHCVDKDEDDEVIILTDLIGGSVTNTCITEVVENKYPNVYIIAGMNLPLVLEILLAPAENIQNLIEGKVETAKKGIVFVNKALQINVLNIGWKF